MAAAAEVSSAALRASHEATAAAEARVSEVEVRVEESRQASELAAKKAHAAVAAAEARVADLEGEQEASQVLIYLRFVVAFVLLVLFSISHSFLLFESLLATNMYPFP